jgi:hypothetical protein
VSYKPDLHDIDHRRAIIAEMERTAPPDAAELKRRVEYARITVLIAAAERLRWN